MMKQKIEIELEIPAGWEFVRHDIPLEGEFILLGAAPYKVGCSMSKREFILRKVKVYINPLLPTDYDKPCIVSNDNKIWSENGNLTGWLNGLFHTSQGGAFKFCKVESYAG